MCLTGNNNNNTKNTTQTTTTTTAGNDYTTATRATTQTTTTNENYHDYHKYSHIKFFMCCIYIFVLYCEQFLFFRSSSFIFASHKKSSCVWWNQVFFFFLVGWEGISCKVENCKEIQILNLQIHCWPYSWYWGIFPRRSRPSYCPQSPRYRGQNFVLDYFEQHTFSRPLSFIRVY